MNSVCKLALAYTQSGISVVPLKLDGSKKPTLSWKEYQSRIMSPQEVQSNFQDVGIGVVTGSVSGNLEVVDFDMNQLLSPVLSMLPESLVSKLSIYETPGGWHVIYRCDEICGNTKIAMWEPVRTPTRTGFGPTSAGVDKGVRIESRGEGGYIVAEGSPCAVHSSGIPYAHYRGPLLTDVQRITPDERKQLWLTCNKFDLSEQRKQQTQQVATVSTEHNRVVDYETPWDWFDRVGTWDGILLPLGWKRIDKKSFTRPGKTSGVSAVLVETDGIELLKVFSTSVDQSRHKAIGKFNALVEFQFGGNREEASKHVHKLMKGYR